MEVISSTWFLVLCREYDISSASGPLQGLRREAPRWLSRPCVHKGEQDPKQGQSGAPPETSALGMERMI